MTQQFLSRIADVVFDQVAADQALFRALDGKGNRIFEASRGMDRTSGAGGARRDADETIVGRVLEIGRPVLVRDLLSEPLFADLELDGSGQARSVLSYPWTLRGRPAGVVYLARNSAGRPSPRAHLAR